MGPGGAVSLQHARKFWESLSVCAWLIFFLFSNTSSAQTLAEKLQAELGKNPTRAELCRALKKHLPKNEDYKAEDILLPKEYTDILFGEKLGNFISTAQDTNPFLHEEAHDSGFMVSADIEEMTAWPYSPIHGQSFLIPRFMVPAKRMQIGHFSDEENISTDIEKHIFDGYASRDQKISFWMHPEDLKIYLNFLDGGAKGAPKNGYGIQWDYVGIAPNGPRSLMMIDLNHPDRDPIWVKVNLHKQLEGSTRLIPTHKATRSVLATRLLEENVTDYQQKKWGFYFMPEVGAWSLPYTERSNVVRDMSLVTMRGRNYVYAYTPFSPVGVEDKSEILAVKWLGPRPTKKKLETLARQVFALMAKPFAYNALVTGLNFEWHTANWMLPVTEDGPGDHVVLQDMEALRYDAQIAIWNGGTAKSLQTVNQPWMHAKYSNAHGGRWAWYENENRKDEGFWLEEPEFLGDEYIWRVRGLKETEDPREATTTYNMYGYSTIVDVVRNFGIHVMGFDLSNEEVERWMDEEMAKAFNFVLREELKIPAEVIPDVTGKQVLREVLLMKDYERLEHGDGFPRGVENVREKIHTEGGLVRALWQVRELRNHSLKKKHADRRLQKILAAEAQRLSLLQRNTRKDWYDLTASSENLYFLLHEEARIIEVRDTDGWLGFFSLEHDGAPNTIKLYQEIHRITGQWPAGMNNRRLSTCRELLESSDVLERDAPFGDRAKATPRKVSQQKDED